ncbi:MAG: hypothetical protein HQM08_20470, partial [Candidatus Riflebacteria bacterium]|nr:hypothetical protein [Candidatus Riflebacteria bacterium]
MIANNEKPFKFLNTTTLKLFKPGSVKNHFEQCDVIKSDKILISHEISYNNAVDHDCRVNITKLLHGGSAKFGYMQKTFLLIMVLICTNSFSATPSPTFGQVDFRLLMILHPSMACYDYSHSKFIRPGAVSKRPEQINSELEAAWRKARPIIDSLKKKQEKLLKEKADFLAKKEMTINQLMATTAKGEGGRERGKLISEYVERYDAEEFTYNDNLKKVSEELESAEESAYSVVYLNSKETKTQLDAIKNEIAAYISQTAQENGIGTVIDNSFIMRKPEQPADLAQIPTVPDAVDTISSSLFQNFAGWQNPPVS